MNRRRLITVSAVGLVLAVASVAFLLIAVGTFGAPLPFFAAPVAGIAGSVFAAITLLGRARTSAGFRIAIPILAGVSALLTWVGIAWLYLNFSFLQTNLVYYSGGDPADWTSPTILGVAFVVYLIAATLYGFAGQAQGVKVAARTGLLVLLLLAVIPVVNILGLIGFLITAVRRTATPEPPAASV